MVSGTMIPIIYTAALSKQIELHTLEITSYTNLGTKIYEGLIYSYQGAEVQTQTPFCLITQTVIFTCNVFFF